MKEKRYKPLGWILLLFLLPLSLPAQDKGYWVLERLDYSERQSNYRYGHNFIDGTITHTNNGRTVSGGNAYVGADYQTLTDPEEIRTLSHNFTENSMRIGLSRETVLTWSTPPGKIKAGEEHLLKMDASISLYENEPAGTEKVNILLERRDNGSYPPPDRQDRQIRYHETVHLDASNRSVRNQRIWAKQNLMKPPFNHPAYYQLMLTIESTQAAVTYTYRYVPDLKEVETVASSDPGEDDGSGTDADGGEEQGDTTIPWIFIGGVLIGGAVVAGRAVKKKNGKGRKETGKEKKETPHSTFRMVLYKDFGDTLVVDEPARTVSVRIEETTPSGQKRARPDLLPRISIAAEEHCLVSNTRTDGQYKSVDVNALRNEDGSAPQTARLKVTFNGPGGMFINHVTFFVLDKPSLVMAEALSFAAYQGRTLEMEMGMNGYAGQPVTKMDIRLSSGAEEYFTASLRQDTEVAGKFVAQVSETATLPEGKQEENAGDIEKYSCFVTIWLDGLQEPVEGCFDLYRLHLGLSVDLRALKGYLVSYDSTHEHEDLATDPKERKKFGESLFKFKLTVVDPDTGEVKSVIPDRDPAFVFMDESEGSQLFLDKYGNEIQNLCDSMKFEYSFQGVYSDNTVWGYIHSTKGGLYPPNRAKAKVLVVVSWRGQTFSQEVIVPILSQPYVDINDNREYSNWLNENQRRIEQLIDIRKKIICDPHFAELVPFYYKIHATIEAYDPRFGIYEPDYNAIMRIFNRYCSGEIGSTFVNSSVWQPTWTEADENFNAFVATWGSMERSWTVLGFRIALGFFTAGGSEVVLAPYSAMARMQDYVNKGGDSAYEGFKQASCEIIFWEGVFYAGGKLIGKAAKNKTVQAGWSKLKDNYNKLKDRFKSLLKTRESTRQMSGIKGVNQAALGNQVKEGGRKAAEAGKESVVKANDAIRKTRQKGDKVFKKKSLIQEEVVKLARKDARKLLNNFEELLNSGKATPDELRRSALAIQGNKSAQELLRNHPSNDVRACFNKQMLEIYKKTDPVTIKKLAQKMGLPESDIRTWNGASGNDLDDLLQGRKIAADRDVTFQFKDKNGEWVDIDESVMEQAYADAFHEVNFNFLPADKQQALKTLKKYDQAVVNGKYGLESYGDDLTRIIDKAHQTEKLVDAERVARTFEHKCKEFLKQGESCQQQAEQLVQGGFIEEARHIMGYGEALVKEGIRQNVKQFKRILDPRIQAIIAKGQPNKYKALYEKLKVLEALGDPPPKDLLPLSSVEEARLVLADQFDTTIEAVIEECRDLIPEVNKYL